MRETKGKMQLQSFVFTGGEQMAVLHGQAQEETTGAAVFGY